MTIESACMPREGERILAFDLETDSKVNLRDKSKSLVDYARESWVTHYAWAEYQYRHGNAFPELVIHVDNDPAAFTEALRRADRIIVHNIEFDLSILRYAAGVRDLLRPIIDSRIIDSRGDCIPTCTMAMAELMNLPAGLGALVKVLNCGEKLDYNFAEEAKDVGTLFDTPEAQEAREQKLITYARNDVRIMVDAFQRMLPMIRPNIEWDVIAESTRIGMRGVYVNRELLDKKVSALEAKAAQIVTDFKTRFGFAPSQTKRLLQWFHEQGHTEMKKGGAQAVGAIARTDNES